MLRIRLKRMGKRNQPIYRVVVADHARPVKGKFIEILGVYNPRDKENYLRINKEKISSWLEKGAKPSLTVAGLLIKEGILPEKLKKEYSLIIEAMKKTQKKKKKEESKKSDVKEKSPENQKKPEQPK